MQRFIKQPILSNRIPGSPNLTLYMGDDYRGFPIQKNKGPFVLEYLERACDMIERTAHQYPRLLAIRFDLRYPRVMNLPNELMTNAAITRFVNSLNEIVFNSEEGVALQHKYVWAKEYDQDAFKPHYHFLLLLNQDTFNSDNENLRTRIVSAWADALELSDDECADLVYFSQCHAINMNKANTGLNELFYHVSYMCKIRSKRFGGGDHVFRCN